MGQEKLINARYCERFPVVRWKDGRVVHVQVTPEVHRNYEQRMQVALNCFQQRCGSISWSSSNCCAAAWSSNPVVLVLQVWSSSNCLVQQSSRIGFTGVLGLKRPWQSNMGPYPNFFKILWKCSPKWCCNSMKLISGDWLIEIDWKRLIDTDWWTKIGGHTVIDWQRLIDCFTSTPCLSSLLPSSFIIFYLLTSDEDAMSKRLMFFVFHHIGECISLELFHFEKKWLTEISRQRALNRDDDRNWLIETGWQRWINRRWLTKTGWQRLMEIERLMNRLMDRGCFTEMDWYICCLTEIDG